MSCSDWLPIIRMILSSLCLSSLLPLKEAPHYVIRQDSFLHLTFDVDHWHFLQGCIGIAPVQLSKANQNVCPHQSCGKDTSSCCRADHFLVNALQLCYDLRISGALVRWNLFGLNPSAIRYLATFWWSALCIFAPMSLDIHQDGCKSCQSYFVDRV